MNNHLTTAILHLDADSFFASVESAKDPALFGKPVITGSERGIATSMSYEAKALGVGRGMPIFKIRKDFPQVIVVASDYEAYAMYSKRMFEVVKRYTDTVEKYSIDECFADLSEYAVQGKEKCIWVMQQIQKDIKKELNISVSIGCGSTKVIAKIGSKWNKPHGITMITDDLLTEYLSVLPVGNVWGIGTQTTKLLNMRGIETAQDLVNIPLDRLQRFAQKPLIDLWNELSGNAVYQLSCGKGEKPKSISRTLSFFPWKRDKSELFAELSRNVENACIMARREGMVTYGVTWFLKTKKTEFQTFQIKLEYLTNIPTVILEKIWEQFNSFDTRGEEYKTTGVVFNHLTEEKNIPMDLFGIYASYSENVFEVVDVLSKKYGRHVVHVASSTQAIKREVMSQQGRKQTTFFDTLKKTGKELCIPYLGEVIS